VNGVAIIKNEAGRNRHPERSEITDRPAEEWPEKKDPKNGDQTGQNHRKSESPGISAQQLQGNKENVEMERSMVIRWVVSVVPVFGHLIAEPSVDSFIKMRGFQVEKGDPNQRCEEQNQRWN